MNNPFTPIMPFTPSPLVTNAEGAFRPAATMVTPEGLLSENELALHRCVNSGGSGRGMSFWSGASRCARKVLLAERKYKTYRDVESTLPMQKNHFLVGSLYHAMQEGWRKEDPPYCYSEDESYVNVNVQEAARLFRGYMANWPRELWGKCIGAEVQLPADERCKREIFNHFGCEVTGKVDMVTELQPKHLDAARQRLPEITPGRYIVDFKTADMPGSGIAYQLGLQAMWYPLLWNLQHPETPVSGIIFDCIYKRSRRAPRPFTPDDFGAYFAPFYPDSNKLTVNGLRGMVEQGKRNVEGNTPNRGECVSWRGEICQFFKSSCTTEVGA